MKFREAVRYAQSGKPVHRNVRFGSIRVILTDGGSLPVFPGKQTFWSFVGMSQGCHKRTQELQQDALVFGFALEAMAAGGVQ
jgi:hypothetical protein